MLINEIRLYIFLNIETFYKINLLITQYIITEQRSPPIINEFYEVMYDFKASQSNQLSLTKGEIVGLVSNVGDERGWWKGCINGQVLRN